MRLLILSLLIKKLFWSELLPFEWMTEFIYCFILLLFKALIDFYLKKKEVKFQCTLYIVLSLCILISNINHLWILYKMRLVMLKKLELSLFISWCKVSIKSMRSLHLLQNLLKSFHYKFITEKLLLVDDRWVRRFYELVLWLSL